MLTSWLGGEEEGSDPNAIQGSPGSSGIAEGKAPQPGGGRGGPPAGMGGGGRGGRGAEVPPRIVVSSDMADRSTVAEYLSSLASRKTVISLPKTADERGILQMVQKNIDLVMADREAHKRFADKERGLTELADVLGLPGPPEVIDCFDISNIQGQYAVASMVEFNEGVPDKKNYRRFRIRGYEGANDPGMIHEAVSRRCASTSKRSTSRLPVAVTES